jgi:DNA polymerase III alpha subunit (gram-positive type)
MIEKKPKTYNEIIRLKKCYTLSNYYTNITENMFNEMYDFLSKSPDNIVVANRSSLSLVDEKLKVIKTYQVNPKTESFDKVTINDRGVSVVPHYNPSSSSSSGGSSSNNNNNNNNNNNR